MKVKEMERRISVKTTLRKHTNFSGKCEESEKLGNPCIRDLAKVKSALNNQGCHSVKVR